MRVKDALVYFGAGRHEDDRGIYEELEIRGAAQPAVLQSGYAVSRQNVVRGIHCSPYGKVVACLAGEMWDVVVDLRPESETYLQWDAVTLSPERRTRVYVPPGVGHGYMVMTDNTVSLYQKLGLYDESKEIEANVFDPALKISWPAPLGGASDYILSEKDRGCLGHLPTHEGHHSMEQLEQAI